MYPEETSWKLLDLLNNNEIVLSLEEGSYTDKESIYGESLCISSKSCYEFKISDKENDGICCGEHGDGYHLKALL